LRTDWELGSGRSLWQLSDSKPLRLQERFANPRAYHVIYSPSKSRSFYRDHSSVLGSTMSDEGLKSELERLRNENAALKKGSSTGIRMKVSEKGAVSIYGMGRFPVTLYKEQWLKLLDMSDDIRAFISANEAQLKAKG
jgi:hypothetical protein